MKAPVRKLASALLLSAAGALALVGFEGNEPVVYVDPVGVPTVCVGHIEGITLADVGKNFAPLCAELLTRDSRVAQHDVQRAVTAALTQEQYDSLVSFTFNLGGANLRSSTLLRKLNAGDCWGAGAEFPRWNKAKGKVLRGLTKRRAAERAMFETGCTRD